MFSCLMTSVETYIANCAKHCYNIQPTAGGVVYSPCEYMTHPFKVIYTASHLHPAQTKPSKLERFFSLSFYDSLNKQVTRAPLPSALQPARAFLHSSFKSHRAQQVEP